ncbi:hypothetical protein ENTCAN_09515 [Enterobacter cancerogenus ATCC 35316]|jgi:hypothetical protein|nr:hypothetical protein ENTCAN_09515 [Enterobacter cancerogenus ATCC 35316]
MFGVRQRVALGQATWQMTAQLGKQLASNIFKHSKLPASAGRMQSFLQARQSRA